MFFGGNMHTPSPDADWVKRIVDGLAGRDWLVLDAAFGPELAQALREELATAELQRAAVGRGDARLLDARVRSDSTAWLDAARGPAQSRFLGHMLDLRTALNRHFFLGLQDYEAHFARYPAGGFYTRHVDSFRSAEGRPGNPRRVSTVYYLNSGWQDADGGCLRIFDGDAVVADVAPLADRLVVFLSETVAHEVLPARRERLSIAGWMRVAE